jgi:hypothetical protein
MAKQRLDLLVVERDLTEGRAQALTRGGVVRRLAARQGGKPAAADLDIIVKGRAHPWVSGGGIKLAAALDHFAIDCSGLIGLDIGPHSPTRSDQAGHEDQSARDACFLGRRGPVFDKNAGSNFHQIGASRSVRTGKPALTLSREGEARTDVIGTKAREIGQDLSLGHSSGEIFENVIDGDPGALDTRLSAPDTRHDDDVIFDAHRLKFTSGTEPVQASRGADPGNR